MTPAGMVVAQPVAHGRIPAPDSSEILGSPFSSVSSSAAPKAMYASARWAGSRLLAAHRIATPRLIPVRPFPILSPHPSCDRGRHQHGGIHRRHRGRRASRAVLTLPGAEMFGGRCDPVVRTRGDAASETGLGSSAAGRSVDRRHHGAQRCGGDRRRNAHTPHRASTH